MKFPRSTEAPQSDVRGLFFAAESSDVVLYGFSTSLR